MNDSEIELLFSFGYTGLEPVKRRVVSASHIADTIVDGMQRRGWELIGRRTYIPASNQC